VQLVRAHISNYRSAEDSGEFGIERDVTCLVGKNESGKTACLQALYRLNSVNDSAVFDEVIDFPSRLTRQRKQAAAQRIPAVSATFVLSEDEIATIEDDLGADALVSREITVTTGYRYNGRTWDLGTDEAAIVRHLGSQLDLALGAHPAVAEATTVAGFLAALQAIDQPSASVMSMITRITEWRDQRINTYLIDEYLHPWLPRFVYFADYDTMPGTVSIPDLIERRDAGTLALGEQALLSLLAEAGASLEELLNPDKRERLIRELENTSNAISDEVFQYWSQNRELEVKLDMPPVEAGATPPLDRGPLLQIRVRNQRHRVSVPFDERSRGFVWFFSFLAYFSNLEQTSKSDLILLLDEPGLSLHARAQEDLLRLIDDRLAPRHQVIYTTHSPFMVSARRLDRVRTVIDEDRVGTKVSADIFRADEDTAFPLLAAMGIELTQTLFVGENSLLLEGPSDLIYCDVLTEALALQGRAGLDPAWVKIPIGGAGKLSTFVTLLGANKLKVAVVVDSSTKDVGAVKRLRDNDQLDRRALVEISAFTGTADADIEDLFEPGFYLNLVNQAYAQDLPTPITAADLNRHDPRIVRQIETYFRDKCITGGRFNHYRPAAELLRQQTSLIPKINAATLDKAALLFKRLNELIM
jgi:ABC-type lipoprotein export system ATPase subunit